MWVFPIIDLKGRFKSYVFFVFFFFQFMSFKSQALVATDHPPFSNFLFTNLFSIKFLYFFIISSLFPYFNWFVSIFIKSYVNIKLHASTWIISIYIGSTHAISCYNPSKLSMDNAWTSNPTCANMTLEIPTSNRALQTNIVRQTLFNSDDLFY